MWMQHARSRLTSMLHADLDDTQRPHLVHVHPDLVSSPSSSSSSVPTTSYDSRRRSKPSSHHRSHTTTEGSTSSHLLARLISSEEEVREINAVLAVTSERLEAESSRASAAERRALDYFHRLRTATEGRERADQECARLREELKLYKLQLENAQKEIFRAQDIIDQVSAQRNEAEADAARARTKARRLQEEKMVMLAREEGHRAGYKEGLSMGRRIGYEENYTDEQDAPEHIDAIADDERNDSQLHSSASSRHPPIRPESPPERTFESAPPIPIRITPRTPSREIRSPSPPEDAEEPETIRPIPIPMSPATPVHHITDGWIPTADARTSYIPVPPPHELHPIPPSPASIANELQNRRAIPQPEPRPVPPPLRTRDYAYHVHVPPPIIPSSLGSHSSTHVSQYDLVNKRPGSSLRNEIYRASTGSQPSRSNTSRNEYREQDRRLSGRTEAETIAEQWRADSESDSSPTPPPRNPPRSATPARPRRPMEFYYRPSVPPTPLGDVHADPRSRAPAPVPTEPTPRPPPDDPGAHVGYLRQRFRQRPSSGGSGSIPNIVVESPSEPETVLSPSATTAAPQPHLLSPEAANRPLPQEEPASSNDGAGAGAGVSSVPWPAGFVPYPAPRTPDPTPVPVPVHVGEPRSGSRSQRRSGTETDRRRSTPAPLPVPNPAPRPVLGGGGGYGRAESGGYGRTDSQGHGRSDSLGYGRAESGGYGRTDSQGHARSDSLGYGRADSQGHARSESLGYGRADSQGYGRSDSQGYGRTDSQGYGRTDSQGYGRTGSHSSSGDGRDRGYPNPNASANAGRTRARTQSAAVYEAAPLPPGVVYPVPPVRPHTSHRERERERDRGGDRNRHEGRKDSLGQSPGALGRPISLFDSDEER